MYVMKSFFSKVDSEIFKKIPVVFAGIDFNDSVVVPILLS